MKEDLEMVVPSKPHRGKDPRRKQLQQEVADLEVLVTGLGLVYYLCHKAAQLIARAKRRREMRSG
jgi:hypothetical protein